MPKMLAIENQLLQIHDPQPLGARGPLKKKKIWGPGHMPGVPIG